MSFFIRAINRQRVEIQQLHDRICFSCDWKMSPLSILSDNYYAFSSLFPWVFFIIHIFDRNWIIYLFICNKFWRELGQGKRIRVLEDFLIDYLDITFCGWKKTPGTCLSVCREWLMKFCHKLTQFCSALHFRNLINPSARLYYLLRMGISVDLVRLPLYNLTSPRNHISNGIVLNSRNHNERPKMLWLLIFISVDQEKTKKTILHCT